MGQTPSGQSVTIVNRLYPPIAGVTGEAALELATYLQNERGIHVNVVHVDGKYFGKSGATEAVGTVYLVNAIYNGRVKLLRLMGNLIEGYRLIRKAKRVKSSHIIVMTDPPLVSMWASLLLRKKHPWSLWTMDIYPQAFIANKLVSERNVLYNRLLDLTYRNAPKQIVALGPEQEKYVSDSYKRELDSVILPCGIHNDNNHNAARPSWKNKDDGKIYFGYCGNLGEAHSAQFVKKVIQQLVPSKHRLILSTYGRNGDHVKQIAATNEAVEIVDFVHRYDLKHLDVHLVTLLEEWTHVCVPSKAVSAICSGGAMLFCGSTQCDSWKMLGKAGWLIDHSEEMNKSIEKFMESLTCEDVEAKKESAAHIAESLIQKRDSAFCEIADSVLVSSVTGQDKSIQSNLKVLS